MSTIQTNSRIAPGAQAINTPIETGGASAGGNQLANDKDLHEAQTDSKFGDVLQKIQAKYGAKPEKPREIKKTLGKDDFLRIMITQMQHQDPTNPFKAEQMATEMAQFTSVEQMQNLNQGMNKMVSANQPLERLAMTNLIGKTVTVDRNRFPHSEGTNESLNFNLPRDASEVKVAIVSESGETVLEKDLGTHKAGEGSFAWDGLKSNTLPAKAGNYIFRIEAKDDKGQSIHTDSIKKARVVGVSFEGTEAVALIGDATHQDKVSIKNLTRIEDGGPAPAFGTPSTAASAAASGGAPAGGANFISFRKGEGSSNLDPGALPPEAAAALAKYQQQAAAQAEPANAGGMPAGGAPMGGSAMGGAPGAGSMAAPRAPMPSMPESPQAPAGGARPAGLPPGLAEAAAQIGAGGRGDEKGFPNGLSGN